MKFFIVLFVLLFFVLLVWVVDVQMGFNGNFVFDFVEVIIFVGELVYFVNNMFFFYNVIVEDYFELGYEVLVMMFGEEFDVVFFEVGDYIYWCGFYKGVGMVGIIYVE